MRQVVLALALVATAVPAFAADAPVAQTGAMLRDANNMRLGRVDGVRADGSVSLFMDSHVVVVPADKLSLVDGKLTTSLTKKQIATSY